MKTKRLVSLNSERLLKATEVAEILNVSRAFAYQLMKQGKIRTVSIENARRVRPQDLKTYIEAHITPVTHSIVG